METALLIRKLNEDFPELPALERKEEMEVYRERKKILESMIQNGSAEFKSSRKYEIACAYLSLMNAVEKMLRSTNLKDADPSKELDVLKRFYDQTPQVNLGEQN